MNGTRAFIAALAAAILLVGGSLALGSVWPRPTKIEPLVATGDKAKMVEAGRSYFAMSCAHCHADDATGDEGPNLHKLDISDAHVSLILKNGIKGEMPNFSKKYDDAQIAAITAFLRTLK